MSDGIVEQFDPGRTGDRQQFGLDGVRTVLARHGPDVLSDLFTAVEAHAETPGFQDDATAVVVAWGQVTVAQP